MPEWPYTAHIRRNLVLSSLLPAAIGLARSLLLEVLMRSLPTP